MGLAVTADAVAHARAPLAERSSDLNRVAELSGGSVVVEHVPFLAQVDVRLDPAAAVEQGVASEVALEGSYVESEGRAVRLDRSDGHLLLPMTPNTVWEGGSRAALWLGPDEWLVLGPPGTHAELVSALRTALDGLHHSAVDVSANRVGLALSGPGRYDLLAAGCGLDLDPRAWRPGMCAQTLLARVPVILHERVSFTGVLIRPSLAGYLIDWMLDYATP
jgi:sarcosine oxidase subunit gamma